MRSNESEREYENKSELNEIPSIMHFIWLGNVLDKKGKNNIIAWKKQNPNYEARLWIDSNLFYSANKNMTTKNKRKFKNLKKWAKNNDIQLFDLSLDEGMSYKNIIGAAQFLNKMPNNMFYFDEINGDYRNLAAASDILRLYILKNIGGIYFDVKDIFPGDKELPCPLYAPHGFYCHAKIFEKSLNIGGAVNSGRSINNDILGSVPEGKIIDLLFKEVLRRYDKLYSRVDILNAHRNPDFTHPYLVSDIMDAFDESKDKKSKLEGIFSKSLNARHLTTIWISGPGAVFSVLNQAGFLDHLKEINFSNDYYKLPEIENNKQQELSWYDPESLSDINKIIPILRSHVIAYFDNLIDQDIEFFQSQENFYSPRDEDNEKNNIKIIKQDSSPRFFEKTVSTQEVVSSLMVLKSGLHALSPTCSFVDIVHMCKGSLNKEQWRSLKSVQLSGWEHDIFYILERCSKNLEKVIEDFKINYDPVHVADMIKLRLKSPLSKNKKNIEDFVRSVLYSENGPENLQEYIFLPKESQKKKR